MATPNNNRSSKRISDARRHGGRGPTIQDFAEINTGSRGWRVCTRHDVERSAPNTNWSGYCCVLPNRTSPPHTPGSRGEDPSRCQAFTLGLATRAGKRDHAAPAGPPYYFGSIGIRAIDSHATGAPAFSAA